MSRGEPVPSMSRGEPAPSSRRAPIGMKAVCPVCKEEFSRKQFVLKHLTRIHKFGLELARPKLATVQSVQTECVRCGK